MSAAVWRESGVRDAEQRERTAVQPSKTDREKKQVQSFTENGQLKRRHSIAASLPPDVRLHQCNGKKARS